MSDWERPIRLQGFTVKVKTGLGNAYITINEQNGKPIEIFAIIGKSGKSVTAKTEAIGRLASLCLQNDIEVKEVVDQLKGIMGENPVPIGDQLILSIPDAIAKILEREYLKKEIKKED